MKKRLSWAILALVLVFTSIGPISAAEVNYDMEDELEGEWVLVSDEQETSILPTDSAVNTQMDADENVPTSYAYPSVHGSVSYIKSSLGEDINVKILTM